MDEYRELQKGSCRTNDRQIKKQTDFVNKLDDLFDMAHADAMNLIKEEEVRVFLISQRKKGRVGCLMGVLEKQTVLEQRKEQRTMQRKEREENRIEKAMNESLRNGTYCNFKMY